MLTTRNRANYDPVAAYGLAYQILPKAVGLTPDQVDKLQEALAELQAAISSAASQVRSNLTSTGDPNSEDEAAKRARLMAVIFNALVPLSLDSAQIRQKI